MGERCFLALDLPGNVLDEVMRIQQELERKKLFFGKCTEKENIHLTLKFLGEIDEDTLKNVKEKLKKIKIKPFTATL
ncbi:RNA 2',3'-cyclic phosphodiesterase, partial [Candidatus Woesearchaeota archaeon]|nr:RNA 2',3'-cyclic phosphodiesterase [Candidatus Woesearchaeota archaeon]